MVSMKRTHLSEVFFFYIVITLLTQACDFLISFDHTVCAGMSFTGCEQAASSSPGDLNCAVLSPVLSDFIELEILHLSAKPVLLHIRKSQRASESAVIGSLVCSTCVMVQQPGTNNH